MTVRIKRDRIPFTCPNCPTRVYSRPTNKLICGQCHIPLEPQFPAYYPQAMDSAKPNIPTVPPAEIPLEQLALPAHIRHLLDSITEPAPEPEDASVVRQPEQEKKPKRKAALPDEILAKIDRYIRACLKQDAKNGGAKRSGWRKILARDVGRDPSWVTHRVRKVQAEDQAQAESQAVAA